MPLKQRNQTKPNQTKPEPKTFNDKESTFGV